MRFFDVMNVESLGSESGLVIDGRVAWCIAYEVRRGAKLRFTVDW